jgi:hypothetical protein
MELSKSDGFKAAGITIANPQNRSLFDYLVVSSCSLSRILFFIIFFSYHRAQIRMFYLCVFFLQNALKFLPPKGGMKSYKRLRNYEKNARTTLVCSCYSPKQVIYYFAIPSPRILSSCYSVHGLLTEYRSVGGGRPLTRESTSFCYLAWIP